MIKKMKSLVLSLLVLSLISGSSLAMDTASIQTSSNGNAVPGQLIISVKGSTGISVQAFGQSVTSHVDTIESAGLDVISSLTGIPDPTKLSIMSTEEAAFKSQVIENMGYVYLVNYNEKQFKSIAQAQKDIEKRLKTKGMTLKYVEPNYTLKASEELSTYAVHPNQQWQYDMIKSTEAWAKAGNSDRTRVAILDTGIDYNHPNLKNYINMSLAKSFADNDVMDVQGHGTHVAGTISSYGSVAGVMQSAELIPIKVLGNDGTGSLYNIEQGILYAAQNNAAVINMSLGGGGYSQSMFDACQTAVNSGTVVVAASGNNGSSTISYPAAYSNVIAVGAVDRYSKRASFSQYGTGLAIMAPGKDIYSTIPNASFDTFSGTSMATPHVAGVVGLMKTVKPSLTANEVKTIIQSTAQYAGPSNEYGAGIINALAAVTAAAGDTVPVEKSTVTSVVTNKLSYYRGQSITITKSVSDQDGNPIEGATVSVTLTKPNNTTITYTGTTDYNGQMVKTFTTSTATAKGTYRIQVDTTYADFKSSQASTSFVIK